jgi:dTDP-4-dehydrorhamnose reductase
MSVQTPKKKIWVTGANGQLGKAFSKVKVRYPDFDFVFTDRSAVAIEDAQAVHHFLEIQRPNFCINCAAYTAVDRAESEPEQAFAINARAASMLANACKNFNCQFVHFSTDYVFDGMHAEGYTESDPTAPVNVYGASKLAGEEGILIACPDALIIRTSWVFSAEGNNFAKTMWRLMASKSTLGVVGDQIGRPTYAPDLADAVLQILSKYEHPKPGIYHYANTGSCSWFDLAAEILRLSAFAGKCTLNKIPTADYPTAARRPMHSVLLTNKVEDVFALRIPTWQDAVARCVKLMSKA